jgi:hypothetical protein
VRPQVRHFMEAYVDYLERRNEFWTTYGQVLVAVLIIIVPSVPICLRHPPPNKLK